MLHAPPTPPDPAMPPAAAVPAGPPAIVLLEDRAVLAVTGADAAHFLHNLLSANIEHLTPGTATYASLLSPQGKVLFDFFVVRQADGFLIDVAADQAAALAKRLGFYKLRSAVAISDRSGEQAVRASIGPPDDAAAAFGDGATAFVDPRLAALGWRAIGPRPTEPARDLAALAAYDARRIALAVPAAGRDFALGDVVPHDVNFDDLNAIDFRKGCYVGQEIVSRMKHRGTARRRLVRVRRLAGVAPMPAQGSDILAGSRIVGCMGSSSGDIGLAILRLDWTGEALAGGQPVTGGEVALAVELPEYATFAWPEGSVPA